MSTSIAAHGARGAGATMLAQIGTMVFGLVGMIVMARVLTPDDYGLLAMVTVLMGIGALIRDFGMGTAALQEPTLNQAQASNLFWVNALLSGGTALVLALSAPWVAIFFSDERLAGLVPVMAIVLLLTGLQTQFQARLARETRFMTLAVAAISSTAVGIAAGVATALAGWGYWALAIQQGSTALWMLGFYLLATRWLPSLPTRTAGSRQHIRAGAHYGLANVLGYAADNIDTFMIGLRWGTVDLGNYNRASQLFMQPITAIFGPLTQVVIPTLNRSAAAGRDAGKMLLRIQSALVGLATWVLLAAAVTAEWLVPVLIGDQWLAVIPLLQILALGGIFKALSQINYWAFVAARQSRQLLLSNLVTKPIQIILIFCAAFFGVEWVAWAYVLGRAISWPVNLVWLARTAHQPSLAALMNGARIIFSAGAAFVLCRLILSSASAMSDIWMVIVGAVLSTVIFGTLFILIPGGWREFRAILSFRSAFRRVRDSGV